MSNKIDLEQKINDYNVLIDLLEKKRGCVEAGIETDEVDKQIEVYKLSVEIREKTKYRDNLLPLLHQENQKLEEQLKVVSENFGPALDAVKGKVNDMSQQDQEQYFAIKKLYKDGGWVSDMQRIQAYRIIVTFIQKYGQSNDSNQDSE
jgi:predicted AlkP superfamily pyrophosphatase or phosphodiesterase